MKDYNLRCTFLLVLFPAGVSVHRLEGVWRWTEGRRFFGRGSLRRLHAAAHKLFFYRQDAEKRYLNLLNDQKSTFCP